jgi:uncharacterized membrane protein
VPRRARAQERAARRRILRRRRLAVGALLALLVGVGLMVAVDHLLGIAVGMLVALAAVYLAQRA